MSKGSKCLDDTALASFLGTDGIEELKKQIITMLVEEIHDQLKNSSEYILSPDDIAEDIQDTVINEITEEIKEEYKQKIKEAVAARLGDLIHV